MMCLDSTISFYNQFGVDCVDLQAYKRGQSFMRRKHERKQLGLLYHKQYACRLMLHCVPKEHSDILRTLLICCDLTDPSV